MATAMKPKILGTRNHAERKGDPVKKSRPSMKVRGKLVISSPAQSYTSYCSSTAGNIDAPSCPSWNVQARHCKQSGQAHDRSYMAHILFSDRYHRCRLRITSCSALVSGDARHREYVTVRANRKRDGTVRHPLSSGRLAFTLAAVWGKSGTDGTFSLDVFVCLGNSHNRVPKPKLGHLRVFLSSRETSRSGGGFCAAVGPD